MVYVICVLLYLFVLNNEQRTRTRGMIVNDRQAILICYDEHQGSKQIKKNIIYNYIDIDLVIHHSFMLAS